MNTPPSSNTSPATTERDRTLSADESAVISFLISLKYGTELLRPMVKRMTAAGSLDVRQCYQRAVEIKQAVRQDNGVPPLKVPTWEEIAPASPSKN